MHTQRLFHHVEGRLSGSQFGFRKKRSTSDAIKVVKQIAERAIDGKRWLGATEEYCLVVLFDVKNGFNNTSWIEILHALRMLQVPSYLQIVISRYLSDRALHSDIGAIDCKERVTRICGRATHVEINHVEGDISSKLFSQNLWPINIIFFIVC